MVRITPSSSQVGNGLGGVVVNADGSITETPVGLLTLGKIYYAAQNGLAAALTAAGSNGHVVVADAQAVTTALTVPAGATLEVKQGGLLTFSGSGALAINGTLADGMHQMFAGGAPAFAAGSIEAARPEWWGGKADLTTDNRVAFDLMLASGALRFHLARGSYLFSTADAHGNAVTLATAGMSLAGAGRGATFVVVACNATWIVQAAAAGATVQDLAGRLQGTPTVSYGIGVDLISPAVSAEDQVFQRLNISTTAAQSLVAAFAAGPTTALDVAAVEFANCTVSTGLNGSVGSGFLAGNGTSGNVLCVYATDCTVDGCQFACNSNGGGIIWRGGNVGRNTKADFTITVPSSNPFTVDSCRGDTGNMVFYAGNIGPFLPGVVITDYFERGYTATAAAGGTSALAGEVVHSGMNAAITLVGGSYATSGVNTKFGVTGVNGGTASLLVAIGVATDVANPYPAASANVARIILGAQQVSSSLPRPLAAFTALIDGQVGIGSVGSGFAAKEGSNAKQGVATLVAGTVTVANTSVTASSRIFLTAQDANTTGALRVSARTAGTSFTITSSNAGDTGVVAYEIFEPA